MSSDRYGPTFQRNALAPGILLAVLLVVALLLLESEWYGALRFVIAVIAIVIGWFALQAKHWWWVPVFAVIAIAWNPVLPFDFAGQGWALAHMAAALLSLVAGVLIKSPRVDDDRR